MVYWGIFLSEFIILFLTARILFESLFLLIYKTFRSHTLSIHILAIIFFPGVVVHELSHFLVAELLQVPTGEIEFAPVVQGNNVKLGSVQVGQTDFVRRFFIGVAPLIVGSFLLILLVWYASVGFAAPHIFSSLVTGAKYVLIAYGLFVISNTMFSSSRDLEGAAGFFVILVLIGMSLFFFSPHVYGVLQNFMQETRVVSFIQSISLLLAIPVGINLFFAVVLRLILKRK